MLDVLIQNATVVDGTGSPPFKADVAVADGRIDAVAPQIDGEAARTIDAADLHLAPGFIDAHTHSDLPLLADPKAQSKIRQGVTTEVIGNCGSSPAPLSGRAVEEARASVSLLELELTWQSFGEYLDRLRGTAVNVVPQVGHNTVRGSVMGYDDAKPTPEQQQQMEQVVAEAMDQGARGLSTGLYYPPGFYADTEEVIRLARVAARRGGFYSSHIRSESDGLLDSVREAAEIGEKAEIQVEIAHLKASGYRNWDDADALIDTLEEARDSGVLLGCDQYPYNASSTWLPSILPYWAQAGGGKEIAARLNEPETRARLRADFAENRADWDNRSGVRDWSGILIAGCSARPEVQGKTVAEVAEIDAKDPFDTALDLMVLAESQVSCVWFSQSEEVVKKLMRLPFVAVGSDASSLSPEGVLGRRNTHPRSYGTFARVLGKYVRDEKVISLPEATRKMPSLPAERFGLTGRGIVRPSACADLVLFDSEAVTDRATFTDPHQYASGIPFVIVNGRVVIDQDEHTGELPGEIL